MQLGPPANKILIKLSEINRQRKNASAKGILDHGHALCFGLTGKIMPAMPIFASRYKGRPLKMTKHINHGGAEDEYRPMKGWYLS